MAVMVSRGARKLPVTWSVIVVFGAAAALKATFFATAGLGTGLDSLLVQHDWAAAGTSVLFVEKPVYLTGVVVVTLGLLGIAETRLGSVRSLIAFLVVTVFGIALGIGLQSAGVLLDNPAAESTRGQHMSDPLIPVIGTFLASTAYLRPVIGARVRVISFAVLLVFVLYSGQPSDLYRLGGAVSGLLLGFVFTKTRPRPGKRSFSDTRTLLAAVVTVTAIGPLVSALAPARVGLFEPLGALFRDSATTGDAIQGAADTAGAILVSVLPLVLQLLAAAAIYRGQRLGLWLAVSVNGALSVMAAIYFGAAPTITPPAGASPAAADDTLWSVVVAIGVPAIVAIGAFSCLKSFPPNPGHAPSHRFFVRAALVTVAVTAVYIGTVVLRAGASPATSVQTIVTDLVERLVPEGFLAFEQPAPVPTDVLGRIMYDWIGAVFWLCIVALAVAGMLRRRLDAPATVSSGTRAFLKMGWAEGPLAWMTTWRGNLYWYAPHDTGAVAYRVVNGVAVTTGEPLCEPRNMAEVVRGFVTFCEDRGWVPVFYGATETLRVHLSGQAWYSMKVAEDTLVDTTTWSLGGKKMQNIRTSLTRATKTGVRFEWTTYSELTSTKKAQIEDISREWVAEKSLPEMGFTLGGVRELKDSDVSLMLAITADGDIDAVTSWLPTFRNGIVTGLTLDFMRRRTGSMPGLMDAVIAETITEARRTGVQTVSLSAAPLADSGLPWLSRALEPAYGFQSLHRYKNKFQPEIRPVFLLYKNPFNLPAVGLGLAKAYVPDMSLNQAIRILTPARA
ncbi:lysylphosphatidylglycerol synthetase-like protein (DUF2156 family) [Subtercola boreus]|nr:lysylphosphatidylglycerol synthetase-like protein (DUF2156 family) [Subtercola boreus]